MEPGTLAIVLHDFLTTVEGELSLLKGDFFLVQTIEDKHWCSGQSYNKTGKFPLNYLHKVDIPTIQDDESLLVSIAAFRGEQAGDLSFGKGELIVGKYEVGPGWQFGQIDSRQGIFPTTHAWQLDSALLKSQLRSKSVRKKARVKTTLKAQLEEELDLTEGEIVSVIEILDDGWCRGTTSDGREGTFPEGFITYLQEPSEDQVDQERKAPTMQNEPLPASAMNENGRIWKDFSDDCPVEPYNDEPAPSYYDLFPEFTKPAVETAEDVLCDNNLNPLGVKPYAITLYPFNAQFPNELSFAAGEVVHLQKHVDSEWAEGTIDNVKGIFPVSYVNIIVDCSEVKEKQALSEEAQPESPQKEHDILVPGLLVRVDYTFDAQMDGDLSVKEGEVVTVIEMANEDWVSVENGDGQIGLCPRGYLNPDYEEQPDLAKSERDPLEEFLDAGNESEGTKSEQEKSKRLSEPHRPAPPAPAPGRVPLQRQSPPANGSSSVGETEKQDETTQDTLAATKKKRADQRQNVISELVVTEKEYVRDLKITYETFNLHNPTILESRGVDVAILFGNIMEVIQVAEDLLDMMLRAMKGCDEEVQTIGPCFLKMSEKLQKVYVRYCGNHEAALVLLQKYEDNREATAVFQKGIETLRHQIACFDMSSILIKPVQRILKYPLMLYELVKSTEDDHPDKPELEEAWKTMTNVASYINEHKRRKDLVSKYFDGENTLMRKMAKLSMHSVAKKSTRFSAKLSASLGLSYLTVDPEFEELERQFKSLEKCAWQLARDVEQCTVHLSEEAISGEILSELINQYYQGTPNNEVRRLRETRSLISTQFLMELKSCLETRVSMPLTSLITLLEGPAVLITKRHDKLLDYDVSISHSVKDAECKTTQEALSSTRNNYEALNQQLLEELPIIIDASMKILISCFGAFTNARKLLNGKITKRYLTLSETATDVTPQDILESFTVGHNLLWNQITRFSLAGINPRIEESKTQWCKQNERQRIALRNKYPKNILYVVKEDVISTSSLDMGAARGTLVAVIKKQDPMGDAKRWFVDNGVDQGFLPSQSLEALQQLQQDAENSNSTATSPNKVPDLICMDSPEKEATETTAMSSQSQLYSNASIDSEPDQYYENPKDQTKRRSYENLDNSFYYAMYDFEGGLPGTLQVSRGQAVRLIKPHDEKGNDAWWLVQDRYGAEGYVPQNYLGPPPQH